MDAALRAYCIETIQAILFLHRMDLESLDRLLASDLPDLDAKAEAYKRLERLQREVDVLVRMLESFQKGEEE